MLIARLLTVTCLLTIAASCGSNRGNAGCSRFRTGNFLLAGEGIDSFYIERTGAFQQEINHSTGTEKTYKVNWISDCEYELILRDTKRTYTPERKEAVLDSLSGILTTVKIVETGDSYYLFEARKEGLSYRFPDTMWVVYDIEEFKSMGKQFK